MSRPLLYLHVGLQKTGTSFLQRILWDSPDHLAAHGYAMVPDTKLAMFRLALNVRERYQPEIDPPSVAKALERLPQQLRRAPERAVISQEALATASPAQIERLMAATAERDVRLIVTARDLGRQIPSAWQQTVQSGRTERFPAYVRRLKARTGVNARVWGGMNLPAILERWSAFIEPARINVVTAPPAGAPPRLLLERFCSVLELPVDGLTINESTRANRSLRAEQAEVLRRVNELLPPELKRRNVYGDLGKRYFAVQILGDDEGTRIQLPSSDLAWCTEVSQRFVDHVREGRYQVTGDLADLMPVASSFAADGTRVNHRQVAEKATRALADMLADRWADQQHQQHQQRRSATPSASPGVPESRLRALLRRALGRD